MPANPSNRYPSYASRYRRLKGNILKTWRNLRRVRNFFRQNSAESYSATYQMKNFLIFVWLDSNSRTLSQHGPQNIEKSTTCPLKKTISISFTSFSAVKNFRSIFSEKFCVSLAPSLLSSRCRRLIKNFMKMSKNYRDVFRQISSKKSQIISAKYQMKFFLMFHRLFSICRLFS